ncbi:hypothetical protein ATE69_15945 [Sphingopyxis sp. H071]|nr:hypothetical protein ATE69_15945 [Sphingopyxis sp. H071]
MAAIEDRLDDGQPETGSIGVQIQAMKGCRIALRSLAGMPGASSRTSICVRPPSWLTTSLIKRVLDQVPQQERQLEIAHGHINIDIAYDAQIYRTRFGEWHEQRNDRP